MQIKKALTFVVAAVLLLSYSVSVFASSENLSFDEAKAEISQFMREQEIEFSLTDTSQSITHEIILSDGSCAIWTVSIELTTPYPQTRGTEYYNVYPGEWTLGQDIYYPLLGNVYQRATIGITTASTQVVYDFKAVDTWVNVVPDFGVTVDHTDAWFYDWNKVLGYARAVVTFKAADLVPVTFDPRLSFFSVVERPGVLGMQYDVT